jgi:4-amino-4-deoxy-L-arabinose transferase-like glycosyltransferase
VWLVGIATLAVGAALLRFETLGARALWYDEIFTDRVCREATTLAEVWQVGAADSWQHPPLHYALTFLSLRVEDSRGFLRLPSALAGVASVLLLASLGRAWFGTRVGLTAGLLLAVSVYHVAYSMDGRPYAPLVAWLTGQLLAFEAAVRGRRFALLLFVLCGTGAVYTHHAALVAEGVLGLLALAQLWSARPRALRAAALLLASFGAIALLYASQLPNLIQFLASHRAGPEATYTLALTPGFLHEVVARWGAGPGWAAVAFEAAFAAGVVAILRRRGRSLILLPWLVAPFLVYASIPFAKFFDLRFAIMALPAFHLIVAAGVVSLAGLVAAAVRGLGAGTRIAWPVAGALALVAFVLPALRAYATFRSSHALCGNFFQDAAVLEADGGFCRRHLILNSLADPGLLTVRSRPPPR